MNYNLLKNKRKTLIYSTIAAACLLVFLTIASFLLIRLEGEKPFIRLELSSSPISMSKEFCVHISDKKSGLRKIWVGLLKNGRSIDLLKKEFPAGKGKVHEKFFIVRIEPRKNKISDGRAILRLVATDYSWRRWWHGNKTYIEKNIIIDTLPPKVIVLSRAHNINQGGAGLVIYRVSEICPESGVLVGDNFFPGHPGYFKDSKIEMALIALNHSQGPGTKIYIQASDVAGNRTERKLSYYINRRAFKKRVVHISDEFLDKKVSEFAGQDSRITPADKFAEISRKLRKDFFDKVTEIGQKTDSLFHVKGAFLRLPKSARQAGFADYGEYKYKGRVIDRQVHMGVDLASVAHAPVPAANNGEIVYAGFSGIFGKTVIIDHGLGLLSIYSHLSSINVKTQQNVLKGEIIGLTGKTGFAGGDHLHFGIFIHNTFVNPIEWWDAAWLRNNITTKIEAVEAIWK